MTDKLEAKALEMVDQLSAKLSALAVQYGPDVVDAGLAVARLDAAQSLLWTAAMIVVVLSIRHIARSLHAEIKTHNDAGDTKEAKRSKDAWVIALCIQFPLSIWVVVRLLNIWTWTGLVDPKLYIAARILGML